MWVFARHELGLSRAASMVASGMWAYNGAHNQHIGGSGFNWAPLYLLPLTLLLWRRAERDVRMAVALGIVTAVELWSGAVYPVMWITLVLAAETLTRVWPPSRLQGIVRAGLVVVIVTFCLSAGRLLPVLYQLRSHTRPIPPEVDAIQWSTLKDMFLAHTHGRGVAGQQYVWPEFCAYVGPFLLGLSIVGIFLGGSEYAWLLVPGIWAFLLMLGHEGRFAPWSLLKAHVYPFKEMRVPSRFNGWVCLFLSAYAGIGVDRASALARRLFSSPRVADAARTAVVALGLMGVGDVIGVGIDWSAQCFVGPPLDHNIPVAARLYLEGPGLASFLDQPQQNRGRFGCWEEWAFEEGAALWPGDVQQARPATSEAKVLDVYRTQNKFTVEIDAQKPTRILFNSSYDLGWRASVGKVVDNDRLLAVDVPAGRQRLVVKYWPRGLTLGLFLSAATLAGVVAFYVIEARRRRQAGASAISGA
jgi:hypothetical protein